jgi:cytoskeletal protein CcmA (bactofilin family)
MGDAPAPSSSLPRMSPTSSPAAVAPAPSAPPEATPEPASAPATEKVAAATPVTASAAADRAPAPSATKGSVLGPTLRFKGDLAADEDLIVQGRVEGSILHSKSLTIGTDGSMQGDIRARRIVIEGRVDGDLYALESITIRETGSVNGNLYAPRVALHDGARFNGSVDMKKAPAVPNPMAELSAAEVDVALG